jgi:hypothetical protein
VSGDGNPLCGSDAAHGPAGRPTLATTPTPGTPPVGASSAAGFLRLQPGPNAAEGTAEKFWCFGVQVTDSAGGTFVRKVRLRVNAKNSNPGLAAPASEEFNESQSDGAQETPTTSQVFFNVTASDLDDSQVFEYILERPADSSTACPGVPRDSDNSFTTQFNRINGFFDGFEAGTATKLADNRGTLQVTKVRFRPGPNDGQNPPPGKYCVRVRLRDQGVPTPLLEDFKDVVVTINRTNSPVHIKPLSSADDEKNLFVVLKKPSGESTRRDVTAYDHDNEQTLTFSKLTTCPGVGEMDVVGPAICRGKSSVGWIQLQGADAARPLPNGSKQTIIVNTPDDARTESPDCLNASLPDGGADAGMSSCHPDPYCFCFEVRDNAPTPSVRKQMVRVFVRRKQGDTCQTGTQCVAPADLATDPSLDADITNRDPLTNAPITAGFCARENPADADGVCCNLACEGNCKTCKKVGAVGTCENFAPNTPDRRPQPGKPNGCGDYTCGVGTCRESCARRSHCDPNLPLFCSGGACKPLILKGKPCTADLECVTGFCADVQFTAMGSTQVPVPNSGICCDKRCAGECQSCRTKLHGPTLPGGAPNPDVGQPTGECDPFLRGTPAASCMTTTCDGAGGCIGPCERDLDCVHPDAQHPGFPKYFCQDLICKPKRNVGEACTTDAACKRPLPGGGISEQEDGYCADGICCDQRCDGQCVRCNRPGKIGQCSPTSRPTAPRAELGCGAYNCGDDGNCLAACVASGTTDAERNRDCAIKMGGTTVENRAQCVSQVCAFPQPVGSACAVDAQCVTRFCSDERVCTDRECNGPCKTAPQPGQTSAGLCSNRAAGTDDENGCNGFTCDGAGACRTACSTDAECKRDVAGEQTHVCLGGACKARVVVGACTEARQCARDPVSRAERFCTAGFCCGTQTCNAGETCESGTCKRPKGADCDDDTQCVTNACVGGTCCGDMACGPGEACSTGICKKVNGQACGSDVECEHGNCVSGVCCESECENEGLGCRSCGVPGKRGQCVLFPRGQDGRNECGSLTCDGRGACLAACQFDADCKATHFCSTQTGRCEEKRVAAESCETHAQCRDGFCLRGTTGLGVCDTSRGRVASGKIALCSAADGLEGRAPWLGLSFVVGLLLTWIGLRRRRAHP